MNRAWIALVGVVALLSVAVSGDEVGARWRLSEEGFVGTGWVSLGREWWGVDFSGRTEFDLVRVALRSATASASLQWHGASARVTASHSAVGRYQLLSQLTGETVFPLPSVRLDLSGGVQGRTSWIATRRTSAVSTWTSLGVEARPWWLETRADLGWPWTGFQWGVAAGVEGVSWLQARVDGFDAYLQSAGLELGGEVGRWSTSAHLTVWPRAAQSIAVRWGGEGFRVHGRLTLRGVGAWSAQVGAHGGLEDWRWAVSADFGPSGWLSTSLEVRLAR